MPRGGTKAGDEDKNLYRVGDTWYLKIQVRGSTVRESLCTTQISEARRRRDARIAELKGDVHSWKEAVGRWLMEYLPDNVDPATAKRYCCSIDQISDAVVSGVSTKMTLEEFTIERITTKTISEIVQWSKRHRPRASNATLRRDLTALSSLLHACVGWHWREDNPAKTWDRSHIKERRDPIQLPTEDEIAIITSIMPAMWQSAVRFIKATGLRMNEAFLLTHKQVSTVRAEILIGSRGARTKRDKIRVVPMSDEAVGIYVGIPRHIQSQFVFWHDDGVPYTNVSSNFQQYRRRIAISKNQERPAFSLHDLRHLYAVNYLKGGGSIYDLQKILGHTSVKTTEIYLDFLKPDERVIAMRLGGRSA